jgi:hypothetical protein
LTNWAIINVVPESGLIFTAILVIFILAALIRFGLPRDGARIFGPYSQ